MTIPLLITLFLATTPAGDDQVSTKVLYGVITAIFTGMALVAGKTMGKKEAQSMRLDEPVPTIPTRKVPGFVTWDHLQPLITRMDRLEKHLDDVRKEQSDQFKEILEAGSTRESRLTTHLDDVARAIHSRIDDMMRDANHNHHPATKPRTSR